MLVRTRAPKLTTSQLILLLTVAEKEGMTVGEIARAVDDIEANVSRNIRCLTENHHPWSTGQSHGLLKLLRGAHDGRTRHVVLSPDGRALLRQMSHPYETPSPRAIATTAQDDETVS